MKNLVLLLFLLIGPTAFAQVNTIPLAVARYSGSFGPYLPADSTRYFLDANDNEILRVRYHYSTSSQQREPFSKDSTVYNGMNLITDLYHDDFQNSSNSFVKKTWVHNTYNGNGHHTLINSYQWDTLASQWANNSRTTITPDGQGRPTFILKEIWDAAQQQWKPNYRTSIVWNNLPNPIIAGQHMHDLRVSHLYNSSSQQWEQPDSTIQTFNSLGYLLTQEWYYHFAGLYLKECNKWFYTNPVQVDSIVNQKFTWNGSWNLGLINREYFTYNGSGYWDYASRIQTETLLSPLTIKNIWRHTYSGIPIDSIYTIVSEVGLNDTSWVNSSKVIAYKDINGTPVIDSTLIWDAGSSQFLPFQRVLHHYDVHIRQWNYERQKWNGTAWDPDTDWFYYYEFPVGISSIQPRQIKVFPNPTTDMLQIKWPSNAEVNWLLIDRLGSVLDEGQYAGGEDVLTFNTNHLSAGVYYISLLYNETRETVSFVKY